MKSFTTESVLAIHHWNEKLFSFRTTRSPALRFINGQFVMAGLIVDGRPLMRAYSIVSANHDEFLELFSIKVPDGPLSSRLQKLSVGDEIIVGSKSNGTLVLRDLNPGDNLYLFATGTGLAPFLSIIQDPECYERFRKIVLVHCVRHVDELAYRDFITRELPLHEFYADMVRDKLIYYPTVTRESFVHEGRITTLIENGRLFNELGMPPLEPARDRVMICGNPEMIDDCRKILDRLGYLISPYIGAAGDYLVERAFVEK